MEDSMNPNPQGGMLSQDDSDFIDESMKSKNFRDFEEMCCQAYNILRSQGHQLINMFLIMLSAGMPELKEEDDLQYLVNRLDLNISE
jgi:phosphatidylinositol kinase/protein kinase (PI-3  family)